MGHWSGITESDQRNQAMAVDLTIPGRAARDRDIESRIKQHHVDIQRIWMRLAYLPSDVNATRPGDTFPDLGSGGSGTGAKSILLGLTDQAIDHGGTGDVIIQAGTKGSEADTDLVLEDVYNRFERIGDGQLCWVAWVGASGGFPGGWELMPCPSGVLLGKTDSTIATGASGAVSIWDGAPGSETDTLVNITGFNRFSGSTLTANTWVWCTPKSGYYYLTAAKC